MRNILKEFKVGQCTIQLINSINYTNNKNHETKFLMILGSIHVEGLSYEENTCVD